MTIHRAAKRLAALLASFQVSFLPTVEAYCDKLY